MTKKPQSHSPQCRRRLLKALGGSALASGMLLPSRWSKPIVDIVLLPAHAQITGVCNAECGFQVRLSWSTNSDFIDLDLEIGTPGGTRIAPKAENGPRIGQCLRHGGDSVADPGATITNTTGTEEITNADSSLVGSGRYLIFIRNNSSDNSELHLSANVCGEGASCEGEMSGEAIVEAGSINVSEGGTAAINLNCPVL